jgi:hypothetical protein
MARYSSPLAICIEIVYNFCNIDPCASDKILSNSGTFTIVEQHSDQNGSIRVYLLKFPYSCILAD